MNTKVEIPYEHYYQLRLSAIDPRQQEEIAKFRAKRWKEIQERDEAITNAIRQACQPINEWQAWAAKPITLKSALVTFLKAVRVSFKKLVLDVKALHR